MKVITSAAWCAATLLAICSGRIFAEEGAATAPAEARGAAAIEEKFKLLDRDGNGKLSPADFGGTTIWKEMDRDGKGVVTWEEFRQYYLGPEAKPKPNAPVRPTGGSALANLRFSVDYFPGTRDRNGEYMGGTEVMRLLAHQGKLYASLGYWTDKPGDDPHPGAQVLRKDSANGAWLVDVSFGARYLRTEGLASLQFTTDDAGKKLAAPVNILVAGPSDTTRGNDNETTVWTRDDEKEKWTKCGLVPKGGGVRSFGSHLDANTGIYCVFAGTSRGGIYRGVYAPAVPGRIQWESEPEHTGTGRVMCFAECEGALYAACGIKAETPDGADYIAAAMAPTRLGNLFIAGRVCIRRRAMSCGSCAASPLCRMRTANIACFSARARFPGWLSGLTPQKTMPQLLTSIFSIISQSFGAITAGRCSRLTTT